MSICTRCNLCHHPGAFSGASDVQQVPCNVRKFKDRVFTLWRCTGCGSLHCLEDADLALYYADYPLKRQQLTFSERVGYRNRQKLMERHGVRRSDRTLDYGCGAGLYVNFLRDRGYSQVFGYDPFVTAYSDPPSSLSPYNVVLSFDVIEHAQDPREFMRSAANLVRSGGLLLVGTPNADHVSTTLHADPNLHVPYHRHILSERTLLALAGEQGMEPVHIYRRSFYDSLVPTVNSRFMWRYIRETGGLLDAAVEPPQIGTVLRSPELLVLAIVGYFLPRHDNILVTFRKNL